MSVKEVPVFLFLGFLDAGKTKFIQETLEDPRFDSGERTLVLAIEQGEEVFDEGKFHSNDYHLEYLDGEQLTADSLSMLVKKYTPDRVVVEYNGMKPVQELFDAMPDGWMIAQVMTFFDSATVIPYNQNMRQLVFDKIQYTDMVIFNRFGEENDKMEFHRLVRGISRRAEIVYESADGQVEYDDIEDPLPFDIDAPVVQINDDDYAYFYRDLMEEMDKYRGKTVRFKGLVATNEKLKKDTVVLGRHIMTCCEADIAYSGMVCKYDGNIALATYDWVFVTARIDLEYHPVYGQKGPVCKIKELELCERPERELATF